MQSSDHTLCRCNLHRVSQTWNISKSVTAAHDLQWQCKLLPVALPGFVARRGKERNYVMGHSRWTSGLGAAAAWWLSFVTNAVLIERAVSCWHLHQLISQTTQYLDSWLSDLLQSELKMKSLEVEGRHVPQCPIAGDATDCFKCKWS